MFKEATACTDSICVHLTRAQAAAQQTEEQKLLAQQQADGANPTNLDSISTLPQTNNNPFAQSSNTPNVICDSINAQSSSSEQSPLPNTGSASQSDLVSEISSSSSVANESESYSSSVDSPLESLSVTDSSDVALTSFDTILSEQPIFSIPQIGFSGVSKRELITIQAQDDTLQSVRTKALDNDSQYLL